ncbi:MAG: hypothetical protein GF390_02845 [Candidatus Pacebacteria bacterium]|nr:hypothetical protein [Candidatus Paceibacterota bacterium]
MNNKLVLTTAAAIVAGGVISTVASQHLVQPILAQGQEQPACQCPGPGDGEGWQRQGPNDEHRQAVREAIKNHDYQAWLELMQDAPERIRAQANEKNL